ncbi:hypothetical protein ACPBEI_09515 [Latilactobacillus sakei]
MTYVLVGAVSGKEYTRYRNKEYLYRLLLKEWPTKKGARRGRVDGTAVLKEPMPEPMIIRRVK